jgi:hypothetical protein
LLTRWTPYEFIIWGTLFSSLSHPQLRLVTCKCKLRCSLSGCSEHIRPPTLQFLSCPILIVLRTSDCVVVTRREGVTTLPCNNLLFFLLAWVLQVI